MLSANFGSHFLSAFSNFFTKRFSSLLQVYLIFSLIFSHILYYIFQCYSLCQCAVLNDYHKAYFCLCYPRSVFPSAFSQFLGGQNNFLRWCNYSFFFARNFFQLMVSNHLSKRSEKFVCNFRNIFCAFCIVLMKDAHTHDKLFQSNYFSYYKCVFG